MFVLVATSIVVLRVVPVTVVLCVASVFGILVVPRESICGIWLEIILVMALVDVLVVVEYLYLLLS